MKAENTRKAVVGVCFLIVLVCARSQGANAQRFGLGGAWAMLAEQSTAVLVGEVVEGQILVVDPEKLAKASVTADGKPTFPSDPREFVLGNLARVRVNEVLKSDGKVTPGSTVNVFVYEYGYVLVSSDGPHILRRNEICVLFLRPLKTEDDKDFADTLSPRERQMLAGARSSVDKGFAGTMLVPPGTVTQAQKHSRFDPKGVYTPVFGGQAQIILTPDKMYRLDEIKKALAKQP